MASTIDLRTNTIGVIPSDGIRSVATIEAKIDASKISGGLVNGNTYNYLTLPKNFVLTRVEIIVETVDAGGGTSTLTDGSIVPLAAQVMTSKGAFPGVTNLPKWYEAATALSGLIATATLTTAVFRVIAEGFMKGE